jgi:hypothetical protein
MLRSCPPFANRIGSSACFGTPGVLVSLFVLLVFCPVEAAAQAGTTRSGAKAKGRSGATAWPESSPPVTVPAVESQDSELADFAKETDASLHSLHSGNLSLDVQFPAGGSGLLEGGAGARFILPSRLAVSLAFLSGVDKEQKKNSLGAAFKVQSFFGTSTRAFPYAWVSASAGKNSGDGHGDDTKLKAGTGLGAGLEIFVMKELSTSVEVGLTSQILPGSALRLASGTSQIALHYFFGE